MLQISLVLTRRSDARVAYGMPAWYRILSASIAAVIVSAIAISGSAGPIGVLLLATLILGAAYEEQWILDPGAKTVTHTTGFLPFTKRTALPFADIARYRVDVVASGAVPGSETERAVVEATLAARTTADALELGMPRREFAKRKVLVKLLLETQDGGAYLMDVTGVARLAKVRAVAEEFARGVGVPVV